VENLGAFGLIAARAHGKRYPFVVQRDEGFGVPMHDCHEVPLPPEEMALAIDELPGRFARLIRQLFLLIPDPAELGDRVSPGYLQARRSRGRQGHPAMGWVDGEVDMLDILARHRDRNVAELNRLRHQ
jgi:hypothetical protein